MRNLTLGLTAAVALFVGTHNVRAGVVTVSRTFTDDIVVPVFDTSLGTLDSVDLTVTLRSGPLSAQGGHDHATYEITSTNTSSSNVLIGFGATRSVNSSGAHTHAVATPSYAGGGLTIGGFSLSSSVAGSHSHNADIRFDRFVQVGANSRRAVATVNVRSVGGHTANYGPQSKSLIFSGAGLSPFLGASDIIIGAGALSTNIAGSHNHSLSPFSVWTPYATWNFGLSTIPAAGSHNHTFDPRFDTTATFHYTPHATPAVPEPTSIALLALGGVGLVGGAWRKRRQLGHPHCRRA